MPYKNCKSKNSPGQSGTVYSLAVGTPYLIRSQAMNDTKQNFDLDLRGTICPMAFVKLRLFTDQQPQGATVSVLYEDNPANEPLVRSTEGVGHIIISDELATDIGDAGSLKVMTIRVCG